MAVQVETGSTPLRHGEYKIPGGKLVVVDLHIADGCLRDVRLSGDFFMEPPEALDAIDAAIEGLPWDAGQERLMAAVQSALSDEVMMYGLTVEGIVEVIQRALK